MAKEPIVVEVADSRNRNLFFKPLQERLRGRWEYANVPGQTSHGDLQALAQSLPIIPGIHLSVDVERRTLRRYDPLGEPEYRKAWEILCDVANKNAQMFGSNKIEPMPSAIFRGEAEGVTDDLIKDWLYWLRRAVNGGSAKVVSGELPGLDAIRKMPGKRRYMYSTSLNLPEDQKWVDVVEPSHERGGNQNRSQGGGNSGAGKQQSAAA